MRFKSLILLVIFVSLIFLASCGGGSNNSETATKTCVYGAFNCKENAVFKCEDGDWQKIEQCGEDQKCNAVKGICENKGDTGPDNGDSDNPDTDDSDTNPNQDTDTDSSDTKPENPDTDDADTSTQENPDTDDTESTPDEDSVVIEINDEESCLAAGGAWNSGKCTKTANCTGLPENATWNKTTGIRQTWNGTEWVPTEIGSYNETASTTECVFKCKVNYEWNEETSTCDGATKMANCSSKPSNTVWNDDGANGQFAQTWNGSAWEPSSYASTYSETAGVCQYKCSTNYTWNGSACAADTRSADCSSKPANTVWNDNDKNGKFTQTWNGSDWAPATYASGFSKTAGICRYVCTAGYIWSDNQCITAPTQTASCTGLPANAVWNTATSITQTYDGSEWFPTTTGIYNTTASTMECRFKCKEHYSWKNSQCVADTQTVNCTGLPANAQWNTVSSITQTWSGTDWAPSPAESYNETASTTECRYKCKTNYNWNSSTSTCVAATQQANCSSKPANTAWNDNGANGKFTQTWNGSAWNPASYPSSYSKTAGTCRYVCATGYIWSDNQCITAPTQTATCTGLPVNAQWNTVSSITQTYDGSEWYPSTAGVYNTTASTTECHYKCKTNYNWQNSQCVAATQTATCTGLPANASWNTASSITQTWNGSSWQPTTTGTYSETSSTTECRFGCNMNYNWNSSTSTCVAATQQGNCSSKPANTVWNDNGANGKFTQTWNGSAWNPTSYASTYNTTAGTCRYKCNTNYNWNSSTSTCVAATQQANCSSKPANSAWNDNGANGKFTQTWNGSAWDPSSYTSTYNTTAGTCRFKCNTNYNWNSSTSTCDAATQTATCTGLPANASWNTVSTITQTWNGSSWQPTNVGSFSATGSSTQCYFKCKTNYNWNNSTSTCDAATRNGNCSSKPANTDWNDNGRNGKFTQTWDGSAWEPASYDSSYNTTAGTCRYKCTDNYHYENGQCIYNTKSNVACTGLPANTQWNTVSTITQTWNGSSYQPSNVGSYNETPSSTECHYKCADGYHRENGQCIFNTKSNVACTGLPANTQWNTVSTITQTWNGSSYQPSNVGSYNETPSSAECRYKCAEGYHRENGQCVSNTKTNVGCTGLPANAQWNTASSITQTWNGSSWTPTNVSSFSATPSTSECKYKCNTNYNWNSSTSTCDAAKQTVNCTSKPANTVWNTVSTVTQTWNGNAWTPSNTSSYNTTASTSECRYKCNSTHYWYNSECINPCDYSPCKDVANSTHVCTATSWQDYSCGCNNGYFWDGYQCKVIISIGNICTSQNKCYTANPNSSTICPVEGEDFFGQDAQYTSKCTAQSFSSSSNVVVDNNTRLTWEKSPSSNTYTWANANNHCADLNSSNYGGKSNWRVPNPLEFMTIVDNSKDKPATNSNFTNMPTDSNVRFWTSTEYKGDTRYAYAFTPYYGYIEGSTTNSFYLKTQTYKVLCVSGNEMRPATSADFITQTINGSVVVTDSRTGLMWQKEYVTDKMIWQPALKYCEDSTYAGYSDWRLPNKNELASLLNHEKSGAPYSYFPDFPNKQGSYFSSSSTYVTSTGYLWYVCFGYGGVNYGSKTNRLNIMCVR